MVYDLKAEFSGVVTYVHESIAHSAISTHCKHSMSMAQACALDINGVRIVNIYRSPNQLPQEIKLFNQFLNNVVTPRTIIVGDLNLRCNWLDYTSTCPRSRPIIENLFDKNLVQYQFLVTRPRSQSTIDITLSNDCFLVMDASVDNDWKCEGVDHCPTLSRIRLPVQKSLFKTVTAKKQIDRRIFRNTFSSLGVERLLLTDNVNVINDKLTQAVVTSAEVATPKFQKDLMKPTPLVEFTMSEETSIAFQKQRECLSRGNSRAAKNHAKNVRHLMRRDKSHWMMYRARKLDANNDEVWKMIRNSTEMGVATGGLRLDPSVQQLEFDPVKKPEILNQRYASVMTPKTFPSCDGTDLESSEVQIGLTDLEFTKDDVLDALRSANNSYANDTEDMNMAMLRKLSDLIAPVLAHLFTLSFQTGQLAILWLTALVNPIPKPGDPTLAKSLRPVVLENTILRVMEKIANSKIVTYLDSISFFHNQQSGFRKRRSCILNLTDYWSFVTDLMARRGACDVIYMDTSAAFDRLSHGLILDKLYHQCGIGGKLWLWLKAWMTNRWQFVRLNGHDSKKIPVTSSCMQGSCLGTTLWNVYINEVCWLIEKWIDDYEITDCAFFFYADDVKIAFFPSDHNVRQMNRLLRNLTKEMDRLYLAFNPDKCSVLTMGFSNPCLDLFLPDSNGENVKLTRVTCERDLGLQVSSDGVFSKHIEKSLHTSTLTSKFLARIFHTSTWGTKVQLYYGLIFSRMAYASELWRPSDMTLFNKIYINFFKFTKPPKKSFPPWVPEQLMIKKDLILLWQIFNDMTPIDTWKIFPDAAYDDTVKRGRPRAQVPKPKYNAWTKNLVLVRNIDLWNKIPLAVRTFRQKKYFEEYLEEHVLPTLECNSIREEILSGEMRRKAKKHTAHLEYQRKWNEDNLADGNAANARPDPFYEDDEFLDDFLVSDHCLKSLNRKSQSTLKKLSEYAPHMLLCHCNSPICIKETEDFEKEYGPIRLIPKAYVKDGEVRNKYGRVTTKLRTLSEDVSTHAKPANKHRKWSAVDELPNSRIPLEYEQFSVEPSSDVESDELDDLFYP